MRLKLDENLPGSVVPRLAALGFDVDTVLDENLGGRSDETVWAAAQGEQRFLVTVPRVRIAPSPLVLPNRYRYFESQLLRHPLAAQS